MTIETKISVDGPGGVKEFTCDGEKELLVAPAYWVDPRQAHKIIIGDYVETEDRGLCRVVSVQSDEVAKVG